MKKEVNENAELPLPPSYLCVSKFFCAHECDIEWSSELISNNIYASCVIVSALCESVHVCFFFLKKNLNIDAIHAICCHEWCRQITMKPGCSLRCRTSCCFVFMVHSSNYSAPALQTKQQLPFFWLEARQIIHINGHQQNISLCLFCWKFCLCYRYI